ncbi:MAG: Asp-tRNA(Asn)/Glu-tRNA(Gln) amidotransferase subunit GatC, partial [Caldilineae bacterium]
MSRLSTEQVKHVAELAKLHLSDEEIQLYAAQLSAVLDYAAQLQEVDTSHVPPTATVLPLRSIMR